MTPPFSIEAMAIDHSFIDFCLHRNEKHIQYWTDYLAQYPGEIANVEEAKSLVLGLTIMLYEQQELLSAANHTESPLYIVPPQEEKGSEIHHMALPGRKRKIWVAAAVIAGVLLTGLLFLGLPGTKKNKLLVASTSPASTPLIYTTSLAEKKTIFLPDSTKVILNAGSKLMLADDFGKDSRMVRLEGEALFDVTRNELVPFLVKVDKYYVRVLGTIFNVRAYAEESSSETSLLKGKVEVFMRKDSTHYFFKVLKPKEKFILRKIGITDSSGEKKNGLAKIETSVAPLTYTEADENVETSWSDNLLVINNESLGALKERFERWYDVRIFFDDETVKNYRFTATFKNETIEQVLKALQVSYSFSYTIKDKTISIGK